MTLKKYNKYRMVVAMLLAFGVSISVSTGNYLLPLVAMILGWLILYNLRQQVDGGIADECDYALAGTSARYTITAVSVLLALGFFVLMHFASDNHELYNLAMLSSYLVCGIMLLNSAIFYYLKLKMKTEKRSFKSWIKTFGIYFIIAGIFAAIFTIGSLRLISGEDDWICDNGQWIKHGQPSAPQPTETCPTNYAK